MCDLTWLDPAGLVTVAIGCLGVTYVVCKRTKCCGCVTLMNGCMDGCDVALPNISSDNTCCAELIVTARYAGSVLFDLVTGLSTLLGDIFLIIGVIGVWAFKNELAYWVALSVVVFFFVFLWTVNVIRMIEFVNNAICDPEKLAILVFGCLPGLASSSFEFVQNTYGIEKPALWKMVYFGASDFIFLAVTTTVSWILFAVARYGVELPEGEEYPPIYEDTGVAITFSACIISSVLLGLCFIKCCLDFFTAQTDTPSGYKKVDQENPGNAAPRSS